MIHYIIQVITFQLLFLVVYDLFLKKETFFNLNRIYLLVTPVLSLVLPFIKIESLKEAVPRDYVFYLPEVTVENTVGVSNESWISSITVLQWVIIAGVLVSLLLFIFKLIKIYKLKAKGEITKYQYYTEIVIKHSSIAFSFLRNIFLGDEVLKKDYKHIVEHELVHIYHRHSWDLVFFELLRIIFWFNPLVYIYQNRITELHEFTADAHTVKTNKKEHYQHLLEEVFKTEKISFINQFFNHSLIKKRIVMLQKSKTKKVWQLKYLLLIPVLLGMLVYTSCEKEVDPNEFTIKKENKGILKFEVEDFDNLSIYEEQERDKIIDLFSKENYSELLFIDKKSTFGFVKNLNNPDDDSYILFPNGAKVKGNVYVETKDALTPFSKVKAKPTFKTPCEINGMDHSECFKQKLDQHVMKTFKYPEEAIEKKIEGRVYINFKINIDGSVKVINSRAPHPILDQEAIRIIESLPVLNPGTDENGNIVPVTFAYPIVFKLN